VAGHLSLAHGETLGVGLGLFEAKIKNWCFSQFLDSFGHRWVAMVARGVTMRGHGDEGECG